MSCPGAFHASDLLPPKMRIHFGEILNQTSTSTDNPTRNLAADGADSAVRKIPLKSPNMPPDQALLKGLSLQKERETIQLTEYSLPLFNLSHFPEGCVPLIFPEWREREFLLNRLFTSGDDPGIKAKKQSSERYGAHY